MKIPNRDYTPEFRELAVKRVRDGKPIGTVVKELDLVEQTLRNWVKAAEAGKPTGSGPGSKKATPEEMELSRFSRLRAEKQRLKRECEILKKAVAYFAKDVL